MPEHRTSEDPARAVERMVSEHGGALYAMASRFCGSRDEAEDLVQEVFLSVYRSWDGFRGEASEKTWLYRIAANACQRMHRRRAGEPERIGSLEELMRFGDPLVAEPRADAEDPGSKQQRAEARERIEAAIAALPEDFRVPLVLKEIAGLSVADVSAVLGLEPGTVRSRVHRARMKLRDAVDRAMPATGEPLPAYDKRACLDLLDAKQEALDRGVPFDSGVICRVCSGVFASLDLAHSVCRDLAAGGVPEGLRERLREQLATGRTG